MRKQQSMNLSKLLLPLYSSVETHLFTVPYTQINKVQKWQIYKIWTWFLFDDIIMQKQQSLNLFKLFSPLYSSLETHIFTVPDRKINKVHNYKFVKFEISFFMILSCENSKAWIFSNCFYRCTNRLKHMFSPFQLRNKT